MFRKLAVLAIASVCLLVAGQAFAQFHFDTSDSNTTKVAEGATLTITFGFDTALTTDTTVVVTRTGSTVNSCSVATTTSAKVGSTTSTQELTFTSAADATDYTDNVSYFTLSATSESLATITYTVTQDDAQLVVEDATVNRGHGIYTQAAVALDNNTSALQAASVTFVDLMAYYPHVWLIPDFSSSATPLVHFGTPTTFAAHGEDLVLSTSTQLDISDWNPGRYLSITNRDGSTPSVKVRVRE